MHLLLLHLHLRPPPTHHLACFFFFSPFANETICMEEEEEEEDGSGDEGGRRWRKKKGWGRGGGGSEADRMPTDKNTRCQGDTNASKMAAAGGCPLRDQTHRATAAEARGPSPPALTRRGEFKWPGKGSMFMNFVRSQTKKKRKSVWRLQRYRSEMSSDTQWSLSRMLSSGSGRRSATSADPRAGRRKARVQRREGTGVNTG